MPKDNIPERFLKKIQEAKEQQLEVLDLSNHYGVDDSEKLTRIPEQVFELKHLKVLKLNRNLISKLPESVGNLTSLTGLDLGRNQLTSLPEFIVNMTNLTELNLEQNQLTSLPEFVGNLSNLTALDLEGNQLTYLPESVGNLSNLTALNIEKNQLASLPESVGNLTNLAALNLGENQLTSLPESVGNLTSLTGLYLWENQLTYLPESVGNLTSLTGLYLEVNQLTSLPESVGNLINSTKLYLEGNPLINPPIEIASQGIEAIREYFRQSKEAGTDKIYEAKLLIVGEAGAGKTTLARKIEDSNYKLNQGEQSTEGIDIIKYTFPLGNGKDFQINIWDFGGQEIYHATHRFFLTRRSLYTLVVDNRKEDDNLYYWLNIVELLSDNSPLLIIKNEKQNRRRELNELTLRGQFENLRETLATNLSNNRGLDLILDKIKHYISNLDHIGTELPKTWVKVRQALEVDDRNYISFAEYLNICEANGIVREDDKLQLSRYLHDIGVCLHFQDEEDSILYKTVILKPEWGTDAVYKVLDNKRVYNNQGCFTRRDLKNVWQDRKYSSMRGELLELMKKFELCYEIPGNKDTFIAPQLLSEKQPEYVWDQANNLILRYTYPYFMPKGIISRFIVVMHQYIDEQKYVWKSGVILKQDNTKAEVIEDFGKREIRIRVTGNNKRGLSTIVSHELDKINDSYRRLKYHKLIPCNCLGCKNSQNPHLYPFDKLIERLAYGKPTIECGNPPYDSNVQVLSLIDYAIGLESIAQDKQNSSKSISFGNIEQLNFQLTERGDILGDSKELMRKININNGNYNEHIAGNYYEQKGDNNTVSNVTQNHSGSGDNVAGDKNTTNNYNSQDLEQVAEEIQALLKQLEKTYPTDTTLGKVAIAEETIQRLNNNPQLSPRVFSALKAGGTSALDSLLDHPAASFVIAALEDWQETKQNS